MTALTFLITRGSDDLCTQSYDLWAKSGRYPAQEGDGEYVGNVEFGPNDSYVSHDWTSPNSLTWYAIAIPIRFDVRGRPTRVSNV